MIENGDAAERPTDENDRATLVEMATAEEAVRVAQRRTEQKQKPRADGTYAVTECEECGDEIGERRLQVAANNLHCLVCATQQERRSKWFAV
jgi:RNA polymerase-binding transcription factor DksA